MSLYSEFSSLLPYLQSVRKIKDYLSFDINFPTTWKLPKKYINEERVMEQESRTDGQRLFSFVSEINEKDVEIVSENLRSIIKYNLEREEKERLFDTKVKLQTALILVCSCDLFIFSTEFHQFPIKLIALQRF